MPGATSIHSSSAKDVARLKRGVQEFVRSFGLLVTKQTPCGMPVSPSHAHCLMLLLAREHQGLQTSQSEIVECLTIDKSNIARLCSKLEADGQATQQRDPADGRGRLVELTAKGRRMAERLEAASDQRFARVLERVPPPQRAQLLASLTLLTEAVRALEGGE